MERSEICDVCPELPVQLNSILNRCLAKDPNDRYKTVGDLRFELEMLLHAIEKPGVVRDCATGALVTTNGARSFLDPVDLTQEKALPAQRKLTTRAQQVAVLTMVCAILLMPFGAGSMIMLGFIFPLNLFVGAFLIIVGLITGGISLSHFRLGIDSKLARWFPDPLDPVALKLIPSQRCCFVDLSGTFAE